MARLWQGCGMAVARRQGMSPVAAQNEGPSPITGPYAVMTPMPALHANAKRSTQTRRPEAKTATSRQQRTAPSPQLSSVAVSTVLSTAAQHAYPQALAQRYPHLQALAKPSASIDILSAQGWHGRTQVCTRSVCTLTHSPDYVSSPQKAVWRVVASCPHHAETRHNPPPITFTHARRQQARTARGNKHGGQKQTQRPPHRDPTPTQRPHTNTRIPTTGTKRRRKDARSTQTRGQQRHEVHRLQSTPIPHYHATTRIRWQRDSGAGQSRKSRKESKRQRHGQRAEGD